MGGKTSCCVEGQAPSLEEVALSAVVVSVLDDIVVPRPCVCVWACAFGTGAAMDVEAQRADRGGNPACRSAASLSCRDLLRSVASDIRKSGGRTGVFSTSGQAASSPYFIFVPQGCENGLGVGIHGETK